MTGALAPDSPLTIRIPRPLLENITTVAVDARQQGPSPIEFCINDFDLDYRTVSVNIGSKISVNREDLKLTIY